MTTAARQLLACAVLAALPLAASAQQAVTAKPVNLRAGPARDYPLVTSYGPGAPIAVQGCTAGYGWCDVIGPDGVRGWIYAANIVYPYQNQQVPVLGYGAAIGLPIVTFAIGSYWGSYYRNRPWYGNRAHWDHRPAYRPGPGFRPGGPPHFAPPRPIARPPGGGGRPPMGGGRPPGGPPHMGGGPGRPGGGEHGGPPGGGRPRGGGGGGHGGPGGGGHHH